MLFVHGGPGNCVADYQDVNERFFDADKFYVVEIDQRGTGNIKSFTAALSQQFSARLYGGLAYLTHTVR